MFFQKVSKKFIHSSIQRDEVLFTQAKTLLVLLLFFLIVLIGYSSFFLFNGVLINTKALLNYLGVLVTLVCLFVLKTSDNIKYPLRILNYLGLILVTGGVYWSGGFASNDIFWYVVAAVSSLLFISKTDGVIVTILSMFGIVGFYVIDIGQLIEMPFDPLTRSLHYRFVNAVVIILILFCLVWVLVSRNIRLHKVIQEVQASQIRESISQDFHDELGNKLAAIVHVSKRLKSSGEQEKFEMLEVIEKESQYVYDNFRDFIWVNEPSSLIVSSLFMYLTDFNQQFFAHKDLQIEGELLPINYAGDDRLPPNVVRHVVPLFKELMTNIYKYSNAERVDWSISYEKEQLILRVSDNGVGFDVNKELKGQGLKNIQKRVNQLQGDYDLSSSLGNGTQVLLRVDITKNY